MVTSVPNGAIDCDLHINLSSTSQLLPFLDDHWREQIVTRGIDGMELMSFPPRMPPNARPDWRSGDALPASDLAMLQHHALDGFRSRFAICNCLYGAQAAYSEDLAAVLCAAMNDWIAKEWLDAEPRLRASIVVPMQNVELAVREIERRARDPRFVQILMLVGGEKPLGSRGFWPIYEAAERHSLPVALHAGSQFRHAPSPTGWGSYRVEDYVNYAGVFQAQVQSFVLEGAFVKYPSLRLVLMESGFTWMPAFMWRLEKTWHALRAEVPWVDRSPSQIIRDNVRVTIQPHDAPPTAEDFEQIINQIGSDRMLLFATDYPHWQFEGYDALPFGMSAALAHKVCIDNPAETYARLRETVQ
jgi:uncharacterized protein